MSTNDIKSYNFDDLRINVNATIKNAKKKNKTKVFWKPLLPADSLELDKLINYLIDAKYKVFSTQENIECILISWED